MAAVAVVRAYGSAAASVALQLFAEMNLFLAAA